MSISRRRFLEMNGLALSGTLSTFSTLGALATLSGCGGGSSATPAPMPPAPPDWAGLSSSLQGGLIQSGAGNYAATANVINKRFNPVTPIAIARCASTNDVITTLAFAQKNSLAVVPRCGGHNYAGYSATTGIMLDVRPMNTIVVNNDGTTTIGAGALLTDVYTQLIAKGVSIPSGTCPSVGISGITMGGGYNVVGRQYGLTCDNLVSAQVVTADGQLLTCDANTNSDLFWALRGGGGGNFGVATSFTIKTHDATSDLTNFSVQFAFADAAKALTAFFDWPQTLPNNIWASSFIGFNGGTSDPGVEISGVCIGTPDDLAPYWNAFLAATNATPISPTVTVKSYSDTMLAQCGSWTASQCHFTGETPDAQITPVSFVASSDFFDDPIPAAGLATLLQLLEKQNLAGSYGYVILDLMQGAIGTVAPDATAFVHRKALFSAEYWLYVVNPTDPLTWANDVRNAMQPWSTGEAYVNYMDPLIKDWSAAYYGANYARLQLVKTKYDPKNVFRSPQGVVGV